jgi:hypothetical protein
MCLGQARVGTPAALFASALQLCAAQQGHDDVKVTIVDGRVTATYLGIAQTIVPQIPDQYTECIDETLLVLRQTTYEQLIAKLRRRLTVLRNSGTVFEMYSREHKAIVDLDWSNFRSENDVIASASTANFAAELVRMASDKGAEISALATNTTVVATHEGVETTFALDDIIDFETATLFSRVCPGL